MKSTERLGQTFEPVSVHFERVQLRQRTDGVGQPDQLVGHQFQAGDPRRVQEPVGKGLDVVAAQVELLQSGQR